VEGLIRGRTTKYRIGQDSALNCTFDAYVPGSSSDPDPTRGASAYLEAVNGNFHTAANALFGPAAWDAINGPALAKVGGDTFEILEASALWCAAAAWNRLMDSGTWDEIYLTPPEGVIATPRRKIAVVKLPRGYDATRLFKDEIRRDILAHQDALRRHGMELSLSSPDVVGIRLPDPLPESLSPFLAPLPNLLRENLDLLQNAHQRLEGLLDGHSFLFAIAVKTSTRSDRLYQPLFEANLLKYFIESVLRGSAFKFMVHMRTFEGADVERRYTAASLHSLLRGGNPERAIDVLYKVENFRDTAQEVLNLFPSFL
jgi:hypothetical protein